MSDHNLWSNLHFRKILRKLRANVSPTFLHEAANQAAATAIHYAARCGAKLNEAKAQCRHGEWLPWLEGNCRVSHRHAQRYMRLAREMPELISNTTDPSHLKLGNLETAIAYLSADESVQALADQSPDPVTERQIRE